MRLSNSMAVQVSSLRKQYGNVVAVDDLSFEVERGTVFCIIGPNGAGKTTTIECLEGLRQPDGGSIQVAGLDPIADRSEFVQKIGVQLQDIGIPPRMKPREALTLFSALYHTKAELTELTGRMGLEECIARPYGSLSGGQKRRVNIALALVGDPEIVFLDEPTTGLDPELRFRFWEYLQRQNGRGMTIVATTHYLEEAHEFADTILFMGRGRVLTSGPPGRIIADSGLEVRVVMRRSNAGTVGEDELMALPEVAHVRATDSNFYVYGGGHTVRNVSDLLARRGLSPGTLETRSVNLEDLYLLAVGNGNPQRRWE